MKAEVTWDTLLLNPLIAPTDTGWTILCSNGPQKLTHKFTDIDGTVLYHSFDWGSGQYFKKPVGSTHSGAMVLRICNYGFGDVVSLGGLPFFL